MCLTSLVLVVAAEESLHISPDRLLLSPRVVILYPFHGSAADRAELVRGVPAHQPELMNAGPAEFSFAFGTLPLRANIGMTLATPNAFAQGDRLGGLLNVELGDGHRIEGALEDGGNVANPKQLSGFEPRRLNAPIVDVGPVRGLAISHGDVIHTEVEFTMMSGHGGVRDDKVVIIRSSNTGYAPVQILRHRQHPLMRLENQARHLPLVPMSPF